MRNSRRLQLPPGSYRVRVRLRAVEGEAIARVAVHAGELTLGEWDVAAAAREAAFPLLLPAGARGLGVTAAGLAGRSEIAEVVIAPEALVPPVRRGGFGWPEIATPDRYRRGRGDVRVTVLDRTGVEGDSYVVGGAGAFLVEAPAGATVDVHVARDTDARGAIEWGGHRVELPAETSTRLALSMSAGADLGPAAVVPVRVQVPAARVTFALQGR
jgi:hypothetical protein